MIGGQDIIAGKHNIRDDGRNKEKDGIIQSLQEEIRGQDQGRAQFIMDGKNGKIGEMVEPISRSAVFRETVLQIGIGIFDQNDAASSDHSRSHVASPPSVGP